MKRVLRTLLGAAALVAAAGPAVAQSPYPAKPVRIVVAWPAASLGDVLMRIMRDPLAAELGQPVLIENKAGATGAIGADLVAKAAPDGYTLLMTGAPVAMLKAMGKETPYKWPESFTPVVNLIRAPLVLVAHPSLGVKNAQELVELAKKKPGQLFFGIAGTGSPSHFFTEFFLKESGIEAAAVPYAGSPPAMTDLIAGRLSFYFTAASTALPQVRGNSVAALGVTSSKRLDIAPEIPTMAEQGFFKNFPPGFWNGLLAPAGLPLPIAERIAAASNKVLAMPSVQQQMAPYGNELDGKSDPASFAKMLEADSATWYEIARMAKIKAE
jgi:tripartite-type tricarboxylate transporter receptor subunit TctC